MLNKWIPGAVAIGLLGILYLCEAYFIEKTPGDDVVVVVVVDPSIEFCESDAGYCPFDDAGADVVIGDSGIRFVVNPKDPKPKPCVTVDNYKYKHHYSFKHSNATEDQLTAHSQIELDQSMHRLNDIAMFAGVTFIAWERKFDVEQDEEIEYLDMTLNLHVIYTGSSEEFVEITGGHFTKGTVATIMGNNKACFAVPGDPDRFILVLDPETYDKNRTDGSGVYLIHEMVHLASLAMNGDMDKDHKNKKLWNKHDNKRSVQAIALRLWSERTVL